MCDVFTIVDRLIFNQFELRKANQIHAIYIGFLSKLYTFDLYE